MRLNVPCCEPAPAEVIEGEPVRATVPQPTVSVGSAAASCAAACAVADQSESTPRATRSSMSWRINNRGLQEFLVQRRRAGRTRRAPLERSQFSLRDCRSNSLKQLIVSSVARALSADV